MSALRQRAADQPKYIAGNDNQPGKFVPDFLRNPRLARSAISGQPVNHSRSERDARHARAVFSDAIMAHAIAIQRERIEERQRIGSAWDGRPVLAWPVVVSIARIRRDLVSILMRYRALTEPVQYVASNDNGAPAREDTGWHYDNEAECAAPMNDDCTTEIRPTEGELMVCAGHGVGFGRNFSSIEPSNHGKPHDPSIVNFGNIRFRDGAIDKWTLYGKERDPHEKIRAPKGSRRSSGKFNGRAERDIRYLLQSNAPIAKNAYFFGGVSHFGGNSSQPDVGESQAMTEIERTGERVRTQAALGNHHSVVLEMALTDSSAREIGIRMGYVGKYAERKAMNMIVEALEAFEQVA